MKKSVMSSDSWFSDSQRLSLEPPPGLDSGGGAEKERRDGKEERRSEENWSKVSLEVSILEEAEGDRAGGYGEASEEKEEEQRGMLLFYSDFRFIFRGEFRRGADGRRSRTTRRRRWSGRRKRKRSSRRIRFFT